MFLKPCRQLSAGLSDIHCRATHGTEYTTFDFFSGLTEKKSNLDYMSHHPIEHQKKRWCKHCAPEQSGYHRLLTKKSSEVKHIFNVLKKNGYPKQVIQKHFKALESKPDVPAEDKDDTITVVLPYVKDVYEAMRRILASTHIRTTFRPCSTLKQHLMKPKDPVSPEKKSNVVYSVPCKGCSAVYVGQTSQQLSTRL